MKLYSTVQLVQYYLYKAGRGLTNGQDSGLGLIYAVPTCAARSRHA
jgi:hypothetical protein